MTKEQSELLITALWKIAEQMEQQTKTLKDIETALKEKS